ncbi:DUF4126 domain-containing protein [Spirosoma validum]|uniref:DUF4126 domain-containing protein n=1 Tax=Spirosoma validum TaxID=2771355 RepID=A0A927B644_9BACT|nr:DUF4126 domain-containing protein [Spirosoma validum]MBD2756366.1 DUF4126 domain-containing protein [Spirosoma validum]
MFQTYLKAFQIGVIAGMRAMAAPALLSHKLVRTIPAKEPQKPIHYLTLPPVSLGLKVVAAGEMIADKLPNAPNRTSPPQFIARVASGATCGAFLSEVEGQPAPYGALAGGLGAAVGTLVFFNLRRWLDHDLGIPDTVGALAEDALVIGVGWQIANSIEPKLETAVSGN